MTTVRPLTDTTLTICATSPSMHNPLVWLGMRSESTSADAPAAEAVAVRTSMRCSAFPIVDKSPKSEPPVLAEDDDAELETPIP